MKSYFLTIREYSLILNEDVLDLKVRELLFQGQFTFGLIRCMLNIFIFSIEAIFLIKNTTEYN